MQKAAAYIRVSTEDQTEYSPDAQRKAIEKYAKENDMLLLQENIYIDEGISGRKAEKRPAFMQMISDAKQKNRAFDVILVHKFDRFARNKEDSVVYKAMLRKQCNVKVISISESIEDDKFNIILESMLEAMAEYYSINLADEVKKGMTEKALRGEFQGPAPFGYKVIDSKLEINEDEKYYVEYIFEKYAENMSMIQIARNLNTIGVRTHKGNIIENRTVEYILNNPVYVGLSRWCPSGKMSRDYNRNDLIIVQGKHKAIINQELWDKVQAKLKRQKALKKPKQRPATEYKSFLSSIVKCGNCGKSLSLNGNGYYQCIGYNKGQCNVSHCIKKDILENAVKTELQNLIDTDDIQSYTKNIKPVSDNTNEINILKKELAKTEQRIKRLKVAYLDGVFDLEDYKKDKISLEEEQNKIQKEIDKLSKKIFDSEVFKNKAISAKNLIDSNASLIEINTALKSIIDKIVFYKSTKTLVFYYFY